MDRAIPDAQVHHQITASIRAGGFPHVAAEAWGIPGEELARLLGKGVGDTSAFAVELRAARAQARLKAEMAVFRDHPRVWLEHGPGRDAPDEPGWSTAVAASREGGVRNCLLDPEAVALFGRLRVALEEFPGAVSAVTGLLGETVFSGAGARAPGLGA